MIPHKCPVCNGVGVIPVVPSDPENMIFNAECPACNGSCIVWENNIAFERHLDCPCRLCQLERDSKLVGE